MGNASRTFALAVWIAFAAMAPGCRHEKSPADDRRPDVLLVTIDTLRSDHCSAYGYAVPTTPNLDALAARGVRYEQAYSESATTAPSHAVLMTGRHFRTFGLTKNGASLPADTVTLAEALGAAGYASAAFVSSFPLKARFGFAQGFEVYDDNFAEGDASLGLRGPGRAAHDRVAAATLDHLERWFERRRDDRALFLWVHFVDPHAPYNAPEPFEAAWPETASRSVRRYDAEVRYADKQLGRLLAMFTAHTPARPDLVVVTSDHGEGLGDHHWMMHGINLYEEAVRVPLVASWPGVLPTGNVVSEPVGLIDIAPGVLDLLGIPAPTFTHGRKLFRRADPGRRIYLQRREYKGTRDKSRRVRGPMNAIIERGSKLILAPEEHRRELYDLSADPRELDNLVGRRANPSSAEPVSPSLRAEREATARKLKSRLAAWTKRFPPAVAPRQPVDEETLRALRALGYVD